MAIAFVQARLATAQASPVSLAFTSPLTAGNTAFVALGYIDNGSYPVTVVDSAGNVYSFVKRHLTTVAPKRGVDLWKADSVVGGAATVTATFGGGKTGVGMGILEYSQTAGFVLQANQDAEDGSSPDVTVYPHGEITTTESVELILGAGRLSNLVTASAGYTMRCNTGASSNSVTVCERITSSIVTTNPTPTTGGAGTPYAAMTVSFKEVLDASALRLTQQGRYVTEFESNTPPINLTQMARYVLYPFTCEPTNPPIRLTQLPLEVAYDYAVLKPFVIGSGLNWKTPPKA